MGYLFNTAYAESLVTVETFFLKIKNKCFLFCPIQLSSILAFIMHAYTGWVKKDCTANSWP